MQGGKVPGMAGIPEAESDIPATMSKLVRSQTGCFLASWNFRLHDLTYTGTECSG